MLKALYDYKTLRCPASQCFCFQAVGFREVVWPRWRTSEGGKGLSLSPIRGDWHQGLVGKVHSKLLVTQIGQSIIYTHWVAAFLAQRVDMPQMETTTVSASGRGNYASHGHHASSGQRPRRRADAAGIPNGRQPRTSRHSKPIRHQPKRSPDRARSP